LNFCRILNLKGSGLPGYSGASNARVGACIHRAVDLIDHDVTALIHRPGRTHLDFVPAASELGADRFGDSDDFAGEILSEQRGAGDDGDPACQAEPEYNTFSEVGDMGGTWDVFISHASEDKRTVVLPLAEALRRAGLHVWLDQTEITLGDSLRRKITEGLTRSGFAIVVLTPAFLAKRWPLDELDALLALEEGGRKRVLPVTYGLTHEELSNAQPLIADRVSISADQDLDAVVAAIRQVIKPTQPPASKSILVDCSHRGEHEWWSYFLDAVKADRSLTPLFRGLLEEAELLAQAKVLVLPPPFHVCLTKQELKAIEDWVDQGGGLLLLGIYGERHHASNFSELAWRFDLEFGDDLLLPDGKAAYSRAHVFSRDAALALTVTTDPDSHSLLAGVTDLAFLSAASVRTTTVSPAELVVSAPDSTLILRPLGHIQPDGSRPNIEEWVVERRGAVPVLIARKWGRGRVVAAGSWKLFTIAYGDNARLLKNVFAWLSSSS
jgi:hypothetical protein